MPGRFPQRRTALVLLLALAASWAAIFWRNAWVCDDAFITFRSVEQLVAGNGPRWNPHERVQAFTHPLWFGVLSLARAVSPAVWWNAVTLSFLFSTAALVLLARRLSWRPPAVALLLAGAAASKAFVDFTSSGLENPLTFALLAVFLGLLWPATTPGPRDDGEAGEAEVFDLPRLRRLVFVGSLLLLCRHDLLLIVAPPIAAVAWGLRREGLVRLAAVFVVGVSPFLAWTAFSLVYYGFPFPNTAYAKLNTGVGDHQLWRQGLWYLWHAVRWDPVTAAACVAGPAMLARSRRPPLAALGGGLVFYLLYVAKVGGDFMAGRFLTPVFFVSLAVLAIRSLDWPKRRVAWAFAGLAMVALVLPGSRIFLTTAEPLSSWLSTDPSEHGVADEKKVYTGRGSFRGVDRRLQAWTWRAGGPEGRAEKTFGDSADVPVVYTAVGWTGFNAGLDTVVIDTYALADPLLARLPCARPWRIGHYRRQIPAGYLESVESGENRVFNPTVQVLYERLRRVTQGPLFTVERWKSIAWLNLLYERPSCAEPPCRNVVVRLLPEDARQRAFELADGAVESVELLSPEAEAPNQEIDDQELDAKESDAEESDAEESEAKKSGAEEADDEKADVAETGVDADAASTEEAAEAPRDLVIRGWVPGEEVDFILLLARGPRATLHEHVWRQDLVDDPELVVGPLAGFAITARFAEPEDAAEAAASACVLTRRRDAGGASAEWRLLPMPGGRCASLARE